MQLILTDLNLEDAERRIIDAALSTFGSLVDTATALGIPRHKLAYRIRKLGIPWTKGHSRRPKKPHSVDELVDELSELVSGT